jgi:hypothetical protein
MPGQASPQLATSPSSPMVSHDGQVSAGATPCVPPALSSAMPTRCLTFGLGVNTGGNHAAVTFPSGDNTQATGRVPCEPSLVHPPQPEFLTHQTTSTSERLEKTPSENYCQKGPPVSGGTPGQATRGTCRLGHRRQGGAATAIAGMWPANVAPNGRLAQLGHAASTKPGRVTWQPCRHTHRRHPATSAARRQPCPATRPALISTIRFPASADSEAALCCFGLLCDCMQLINFWLLSIKTLLQTTERSTSIAALRSF